MFLIRPGMVGSLLGMVAMRMGAQMQPGRIYGPRVYASKDMGKSSTKYLRSKRYAPITAEQAVFKRECVRRRRQLAAAAMTKALRGAA